MTNLKLNRTSIETLKNSHITMSKIMNSMDENVFKELIYSNFEDDVFSVTSVHYDCKSVSLKFSKTRLKKSKLSVDQYLNNMVNAFIIEYNDKYHICDDTSMINANTCHKSMAFNNTAIVKFKSQ